MKCHQTEQSTAGRSAAGYTYPIRAFTAFSLWAGEIFAGFRYTKTSANKRFYNMSETYPKKNHCETLFAGHISLQRRNRLQR